MIRVPLPAETLGFSAVWTGALPATIAKAAAQTLIASLRIMRPRLRKDEIDLAPVLLGGRALGGPVGRVIQLIRHLRRPVAADVAVEQISLDRLTETSGAAGPVRFPAGREDQRAPDREVRQLRQAGPLKPEDVVLGGSLDAGRFRIDRLEVVHDTSSFMS